MVFAPIAAAGSFLLTNPIGQAVTATGVGVGINALLPQVQKLMDNNVKWELNNDWGGDSSKRVKQTDKQGNVTYMPLDKERVDKLFGGWQGFRAYNTELNQKLQAKEAKDQLYKLYQGQQSQENIKLGIDKFVAQSNAEFQQLQNQLLGKQLDYQNQDSIRKNAVEQKRLELEGLQQKTLAQNATYSNLINLGKSNNEIAQAEYTARQNAADRNYETAVNAYNLAEERASIPTKLLYGAGTLLTRRLD